MTRTHVMDTGNWTLLLCDGEWQWHSKNHTLDQLNKGFMTDECIDLLLTHCVASCLLNWLGYMVRLVVFLTPWSNVITGSEVFQYRVELMWAAKRGHRGCWSKTFDIGLICCWTWHVIFLVHYSIIIFERGILGITCIGLLEVYLVCTSMWSVLWRWHYPMSSLGAA